LILSILLVKQGYNTVAYDILEKAPLHLYENQVISSNSPKFTNSQDDMSRQIASMEDPT